MTVNNKSEVSSKKRPYFRVALHIKFRLEKSETGERSFHLRKWTYIALRKICTF